MASADVLRYRPHSPSYHDYSHDRDLSQSSTYTANFLPPSRSTTFPQHWSHSPTQNVITGKTASPNIPQGTIIAANVVSNHGKLHKRAVQKNPRGKPRSETSKSESDIVLARTKTPPLVSAPSPIDGQRSPSKSVTRDLIKHNLRKLSHHHEEKVQADTIDLSRTAEENEERSGLGITTSNSGSRSQPDLRFPAGTGHRGHNRTQSHNSVTSISSAAFQPTAPFAYPLRDTSLAYTPSETHQANGSVEISEPVGTAYYDYVEELPIRSRGTTLNSTSSAGEKPKLRLNTSASFARLANSSQTAFSATGSPVRNRRCTNQSMQSIENMTPKSKASAERGFAFHSKHKDEPVDSAIRSANIHAARQAFEVREEAKARKYEEQEQKALDRQHRRQVKHEDKKRRQSDAARTSVRAVSVPRSEKFESGGEYENTDSRQSHPLRDGIAVDTERMGGNEKQKISKKRAVKSRYIRFLTWLKTKFLNMGRKTRS